MTGDRAHPPTPFQISSKAFSVIRKEDTAAAVDIESVLPDWIDAVNGWNLRMPSKLSRRGEVLKYVCGQRGFDGMQIY